MTFISMSIGTAAGHVAGAFLVGLAIGIGVTMAFVGKKEKDPQLDILQKESIKEKEVLLLTATN